MSIRTTWTPAPVVRSYFNQNRLWISKDGNIERIEDMEKTHALNSLLMIDRCANDIYNAANDRVMSDDKAAAWVASSPLYKALKDRALEGE